MPDSQLALKLSSWTPIVLLQHATSLGRLLQETGHATSSCKKSSVYCLCASAPFGAAPRRNPTSARPPRPATLRSDGEVGSPAETYGAAANAPGVPQVAGDGSLLSFRRGLAICFSPVSREDSRRETAELRVAQPSPGCRTTRAGTCSERLWLRKMHRLRNGRFDLEETLHSPMSLQAPRKMQRNSQRAAVTPSAQVFFMKIACGVLAD